MAQQSPSEISPSVKSCSWLYNNLCSAVITDYGHL